MPLGANATLDKDQTLSHNNKERQLTWEIFAFKLARSLAHPAWRMDERDQGQRYDITELQDSNHMF